MLEKSDRLIACLTLAFALLFPSSALGQQQSLGTLRGQVADEFGGLIVGATVTAADTSGVERTATTDDEGHYVFSALPPGRYTVRANAPGFGACCAGSLECISPA